MPVPLLVVIAIATGVVTSAEPLVAAAGAIGLASLAVVAPRASRRAVVVVALALAAVAWGAAARDAALESTLVAALDPLLDDRFAPPVWIRGRVSADAAVAGDAALVPVDVIEVKVADVWRPVAGRAMLAIGGESAAASVQSWTRGRMLTAPALMRRPQVWRNFNGPSERWQRLRRASDVTGSVKSAMLVDIRRGSAPAEWAAAVRRFVRHEVARTVGPISSESAAVIVAILIGDRTSLDEASVRQLQRAGTYHVIAISGGNIAIVVVACLVGLRAVIRSRRVVALITIAIVLAYGGVVGDQASVERAVAAAAVVLGLQAAGWSASAWRIFLLAAMAVLLVDPLTAIDAGAWLSFGATLGILLFAQPIAKRLPKPARVNAVVADAVATLFAATLAAELALMPVSAAVFSQVSVAGLLLNFIDSRDGGRAIGGHGDRGAFARGAGARRGRRPPWALGRRRDPSVGESA